MKVITCLQCGKLSEKPKSSYKFCSSSCSNTYTSSRRKHTEETKEKIRRKTELYYATVDKNELSRSVGKRTRGIYLGDKVSSIWEFSSTTVTKVLKRLNVSCCICGWNEDTVDLHHIKGRKIENADDHSNLCAVCPNHHRMLHSGKISLDRIKTLKDVLPSNWLDSYYG